MQLRTWRVRPALLSKLSPIIFATSLTFTMLAPWHNASGADNLSATSHPVPRRIAQNVLQPLTETVGVAAHTGQTNTVTETTGILSQLTSSSPVTESQEVTATADAQDAGAADQIGEPVFETDTVETTAAESDSIASIAAAQPGDDLEGTVVSNRTEVDVQFFVEGQTHSLAPGAAMGLQLPRSTALMNLYNCPVTAEGTCYWDPYLLQRDGFYEIYSGATVAGAPLLLLREAGTPPADQVWVQNRTGNPETLVYRNEVYELEPTAVLELPAAVDLPVIVYVRTCITADDQSVCEWSPKSLEAGIYYAMMVSETSGSVEGSTMATVDLRPIVSQSGGETVTASLQLLCRLQVPALNIRSGPGLQYQITGKVRSGAEPGTVVVTGRNPESDWLAVDNRIVEGGWVTSNTSFILCDGDTGSLPIVEVTDGRLAAEPIVESQTVVAQPAAVAEASNPEGAAPPVQTAETQESSEPVAEAASQPESVPVAEGQALLVVHNGFQFDIRFTLDQSYRVLEGPSEYDLKPGESVTLLVYPGHVAFTASSPWNGLSGNANLELQEQQSTSLWLRFEPDPDGSSNWDLAWN